MKVNFNCMFYNCTKMLRVITQTNQQNHLFRCKCDNILRQYYRKIWQYFPAQPNIDIVLFLGILNSHAYVKSWTKRPFKDTISTLDIVNPYDLIKFSYIIFSGGITFEELSFVEDYSYILTTLNNIEKKNGKE